MRNGLTHTLLGCGRLARVDLTDSVNFNLYATVRTESQQVAMSLRLLQDKNIQRRAD